MLMLLIVGCLTPESFSERYAERLCEEYEACGSDAYESAEECEADFDRGLTAEICPDWNPTAAAECLAADPWCGEPEETIEGRPTSGVEIPDACKDLGCG